MIVKERVKEDYQISHDLLMLVNHPDAEGDYLFTRILSATDNEDEKGAIADNVRGEYELQ